MKILYKEKTAGYTIERYIAETTLEKVTLVEEFSIIGGTSSVNEIDIYDDELKLIADALGYDLVRREHG